MGRNDDGRDRVPDPPKMTPKSSSIWGAQINGAPPPSCPRLSSPPPIPPTLFLGPAADAVAGAVAIAGMPALVCQHALCAAGAARTRAPTAAAAAAGHHPMPPLHSAASGSAAAAAPIVGLADARISLFAARVRAVPDAPRGRRKLAPALGAPHKPGASGPCAAAGRRRAHARRVHGPPVRVGKVAPHVLARPRARALGATCGRAKHQRPAPPGVGRKGPAAYAALGRAPLRPAAGRPRRPGACGVCGPVAARAARLPAGVGAVRDRPVRRPKRPAALPASCAVRSGRLPVGPARAPRAVVHGAAAARPELPPAQAAGGRPWHVAPPAERGL